MRWGACVAVVVVCSVAHVATVSGAFAAAPPNPHDPCSSSGRDSCGTTGVGFYKAYGFGIRWFGDYRNAVPGAAHLFCIDLGFWYASPSYRYRQDTAAVLRSSEGRAVAIGNQERIAYAIWVYGQSREPNQQAAVMLYVHTLMRDARPGELDLAKLAPTVGSLYRKITGAARRYHGPYRIESRLSDKLAVGQRTTAMIRVLSAAGHALPHVRLSLSGRGAAGLPRLAQTDEAGIAEIALRPTAVTLRLQVRAVALSASRPRIFVPTSAAASANGQRLAAPASQPILTTVSRRVRPLVSAAVSRRIVRPGSRIFDRIRVWGLGASAARLEVELFGPFASRANISCSGKPYWSGRITVQSPRETRSPLIEVAKAGFYTYRELQTAEGRPDSSRNCSLARETTLVAPRIVAGRGDVADFTHIASPEAHTPTDVRIPSLGIRAQVAQVAIDIRHGALGLPSDIQRAGWWQDGAVPGGRSGATLIAGHVDSVHAGTGPFFKLRLARTGDRVQVATEGGSTYTYRVVSVRTYLKRALPTSVYSRTGAPRLVLVTCGGPFDPVSRHYRDNVVLTAVPA
jgi:hypothetical protein